MSSPALANRARTQRFDQKKSVFYVTISIGRMKQKLQLLCFLRRIQKEGVFRTHRDGYLWTIIQKWQSDVTEDF